MEVLEVLNEEDEVEEVLKVILAVPVEEVVPDVLPYGDRSHIGTLPEKRLILKSSWHCYADLFQLVSWILVPVLSQRL